MREIPQVAIDKAEALETPVYRAYDDKHPSKILQPGDVVEGTLTAGVGHTGPDVVIGMSVTPALVSTWLSADLAIAARRLEAKIGADIVACLTSCQYAALLLFVMNLGTGDPSKPEWTIWKELRAKHFDQIPAQMIRFVNWNGQKSEGLVNRRMAEIALWSTDEPGSVPSDPPSSVTRSTPTPPTPINPTPPSRSKAIIAGVAGAVAAGPPMVNQATQAIQPYADHSEWMRQLLGVLAAVGGILAITGLVFMWLNLRRAQH